MTNVTAVAQTICVNTARSPACAGSGKGMAWRTLARPGDVGQRVLEAETPTPRGGFAQ
jgi:hypothetical protein